MTHGTVPRQGEGRSGPNGGTAPPRPKYYPPPPPPASVGYPPPSRTQQKPSAYWPLSIISFLMLFLVGAVALYFSAQVDSCWKAGNVDGAKKASKTALIVGLIGVVLGAIVIMSMLGGSGGTTY